MPHNHSHAPSDFTRAFAVGIALNVLFVAAEAGFGFFSGSLALLADAGHNLSDVFSLALAWGAAALAARKATPRRTYGFRRATILASLGSALLLLLALGSIATEAIRRLSHPRPADGGIIMIVAGVGVVINTLTALLFLSGRKRDLNIKGAYLHMAADAAVSLGVVVAGFMMLRTSLLWLDPVISLAIAAIILFGTWRYLGESLDLALDTVPRDIDPAAVAAYLRELPEVSGLHDLHIWAMSTTETALTAHLTVPGGLVADAFLPRVTAGLHERFGIDHTTLQVECQDAEDPCRQGVEG